MSFDTDALKKNTKDLFRLNPKKQLKAVFNPDPANIARTGRTAAKKSQERQSLLIEKQRQATELDLAESTDEVARRRALSKSKSAGRGSLISSSTSKSNNLGGTV